VTAAALKARQDLVERLRIGSARLLIEKSAASERQRGGIGGIGGIGRAIELTADAVGLNRTSLERGLFVMKNAPPDVWAAFERAELAMEGAFRETRRHLGQTD